MKRRTAILLPSALLTLATLTAATPALADATAHGPARVAADSVGSGGVGGTASAADRVVRGIERSAHALRSTDPDSSRRDLDALDPMVGNAQVVGVGEATHGSREFFRMKHRVLRHLVQEKGFRAFALELPWSSGLRLDDYVVHGKGSLEDIAHEEFQGSYEIWNNQDYRDLIAWIREYNLRHPHDPVHFVGTDMGYAGPELYDRITDYVARAHPELLDRVTALYEGLRPTTDAATYSARYSALSLAERKDRAERTGKVLDLLEKARPGRGADARDRLWAVQNARAVPRVRRHGTAPADPRIPHVRGQGPAVGQVPAPDGDRVGVEGVQRHGVGLQRDGRRRTRRFRDRLVPHPREGVAPEVRARGAPAVAQGEQPQGDREHRGADRRTDVERSGEVQDGGRAGSGDGGQGVQVTVPAQQGRHLHGEHAGQHAAPDGARGAEGDGGGDVEAVGEGLDGAGDAEQSERAGVGHVEEDASAHQEVVVEAVSEVHGCGGTDGGEVVAEVGEGGRRHLQDEVAEEAAAQSGGLAQDDRAEDVEIPSDGDEGAREGEGEDAHEVHDVLGDAVQFVDRHGGGASGAG